MITTAIATLAVSFFTFTNSTISHITTYIHPDSVTENVASQPFIELGSHFPSPTTHILQHTEQSFSSLFVRNQKYQSAATRLGVAEPDIPRIESEIPLNEQLENALVNIVCTQTGEKTVRTTTGTGFIIHPKGVILTNAHVAQFLLLTDTNDSNVSCVVRSGTQETAQYRADLLYISPLWIFHNAELLHETEPRGTGERDYALLYINGSVNTTPLPARFPYLAINTDELHPIDRGAEIVLAGYPTTPSYTQDPSTPLASVLAESTINLLYTFKSQSADIFSIPETPVGEHGASGGPVLKKDSKNVIGMIVTKGEIEIEGAQSLRALTLSYIDRTIQEETGFSLIQNMAGDLAYREGLFREIMAPLLRDMLKNGV